MAKPFATLDFSIQDKAGFEPLAMEKGVRLLDDSNASEKILRKWCGRLAAQPEWQAGKAMLFVCDDQQRRLNEVQCESVSLADIRRNRELLADYEALLEAIRGAKPETTMEKSVHAGFLQQLEKISSEPNPAREAAHFFKYRDGKRWRLVYGWGYQRTDLEPAPPTICTNGKCSLLFVRRAAGSGKCPACDGGESPPLPPNRWPLIAVLVVLLAAAAGLGIWKFLTPTVADSTQDPPTPAPAPQTGLVVSPETWSGPVGASLRFTVAKKEADGSEVDVSDKVVTVVENPRIARLDEAGAGAAARSPGKTAVHFYLGSEASHATISVEPPKNPDSLELRPAAADLAVGTTLRLKLYGKYGDTDVDLTPAANWLPAEGGAVFTYQGALEGMQEGRAVVRAQYRATPEDPYLSAESQINVKSDVAYQSLSLDFPGELKEGAVAPLHVGLTTAEGDTHSALDSSRLLLSVEPPHLAVVEGGALRALRPGAGKLMAAFGDLSAEREFQVVQPDEWEFRVKPNQLQLAVGELAELSITSASGDQVRVVSSAPEIVEVLPDNQLVGRAPGDAVLQVTQEARMAEVAVNVRSEAIQSLAILPERVTVKVDHWQTLRVVGTLASGSQIELAPDQLTWERTPSAEFAEFDAESLKVLGLRAATALPLTARSGQLRADGVLDVIAAPVQLVLEPAESTTLPHGQSLQLRPWAIHAEGRRVELAPARVEWAPHLSAQAELEFDPASGLVRANGERGSLSVEFRYLGQTSNKTVVQAAPKGAVALQLAVDRSLLLVGETGQLRFETPRAGDAVSLDGVVFATRNPALVSIDRNTGAFRALQAGDAEVGARHLTTGETVFLPLQILDPDSPETRLELRPAKIALPVGGQAGVQLFLISADRETQVPLSGSAAPRISLERPDAVGWQPPTLTGRQAAAPFALSARLGKLAATAQVEVLEPQVAALRFQPGQVSLAPGQAHTPRVECQLSGDASSWVEVQPTEIQWQVPDAVIWEAPAGGLPPSLTLSASAVGEVQLGAAYLGHNAQLTIQVQAESAAPSADDPTTEFSVEREPPGEELEEGRRQRFAVVGVKDGQRQPAVNVVWPEAFENDYVRWAPPVMFAKRRGHEQRLAATVGSQTLPFRTQTVAPAAPPSAGADLPGDKPQSLRVVSGQGSAVTLPVGAVFQDFRVEATYAAGPPRDVTANSRLYVEGSSAETIASVFDGKLTAFAAGEAVLHAEHAGLQTDAQTGLAIKVSADAAITALRIDPAEVTLAAGESVTLRVGGQSRGQEVGDVSSRADLRWESDRPEVVLAEGPRLTAVGDGDATVTVRLGEIAATAAVRVGPAAGDQRLQARPERVALKVGESLRLGSDIMVLRGAADLSDRVDAVSAAPSIVRFNPDTRSIVGVAPGAGRVGLTSGDQHFVLAVDVEPAGDEEGGSIALEPQGGDLTVGQTQQVRVFLITAAGERIDRTDSAVLETTNAEVLGVDGSRVVGVTVGAAGVTASLPEVDATAEGDFQVVAADFESLEVSPAELKLAPGEHRELQIFGVGPNGRRPLSEHPKLSVKVGGQQPGAIELRSVASIRGVAPGDASVEIQWDGKLSKTVPVVVSGGTLSDLRIEPSSATIEVGETQDCLVFAKRGDRELALAAADGLELRISDTAVAEAEGLSVRGVNPGAAEIRAQIGGLTATAQLSVVKGAAKPPGPPPLGMGLRFIPDVLRLQLGVPGASVRIVKVTPDGQEQDLDHQAAIEFIGPTDIVRLDTTASGPVFVALKLGQTRAHASAGGMKTRRPLLVHVVDTHADLEVKPDPLTLQVGQAERLSRVRIAPSSGAAPIEVDYQATSEDPAIATVEEGRIVGVAPGVTQLTVTPVGVEERFPNLAAKIQVTVEGPAANASLPRELVLTGPRRTTVGAEVAFQVELLEGGVRKDVTHDATQLETLVQAGTTLVAKQPGCVLLAVDAGTVTVTARHGDLNSNSIELKIDPQQSKFERLELELDRKPLAVGETRAYKLWGHPAGGAARQDLTVQIGQPGKPEVAISNQTPGDGVAEHKPAAVIGRMAGRFTLTAQQGTLTAEADLEVVRDDREIALTAEPASITLHAGEQTPPIKILARRGGDLEPRPVDAALESTDASILGPGAEPGQFVGLKPGLAEILATVGQQQATIRVEVIDSHFQKVDFEPFAVDFEKKQFAIHVNVSGAVAGGQIEYRIFPAGGAEQAAWVAATREGDLVTAALEIPQLRLGPTETIYHLEIEAREKRDEGYRAAEKYPMKFRLVITTENKP